MLRGSYEPCVIIIGCDIIIGIPPHIIMHGMPMFIMDIIICMRSFIMSICDMSIGIILQTMPSLPISIVILHIIGMFIMPMGFMPIIGIIIGMPMPIIGFIMPFIIGIMFIIGFIMPPIIGIMFIIGFMPIMGFIPIIPFIPFGIELIIGIPMLAFIGIAFIMMTASYGALRSAQGCHLPAGTFPLLVRTDGAEDRTSRPSRRTGCSEQRKSDRVRACESDGTLPRLLSCLRVVNVRPPVVTERMLRVVHV